MPAFGMPEAPGGYRGGVRRHLTGSLAALVAAFLAALVTAVLAYATNGAPGTPDHDSWRIDAIRAVGNVDSAVATMTLSLQHEGDLFARYLRTVAVQQEQNAGKEAQNLSSLQPPDQDLKRASQVTSALDDAQTLLTNVRTAVVRGDTASYAALVHNLQRTDDTLSRIEDALRAVPDEQGES